MRMQFSLFISIDKVNAFFLISIFQISSSQSAVEWVPDEFHERLSVRSFDSIDDVSKFYTEHIHILTGNHGVLKFMYTVLLTKVREMVFVFILLLTDIVSINLFLLAWCKEIQKY